jgi:hypothetical protein
MFKHITKAKYLKAYKVRLIFNDGVEGEIDLESEINFSKGVFEPLKNQDYFKTFAIRGGTLSWKNGADISPEKLYELLK